MVRSFRLQRPWAQYDSNFQIMFKVGMGETPEAPADLSTEGHDFLEHCLEHDPLKRWNATKLLDHHFCKVNIQPCAPHPLLPIYVLYLKCLGRLGV